MAVSKFTSSSNVNDFNLSIGSTYSVVNLTQEYPIGAYSFTSSLNDITMDLYFYNGTGTLVGYTNTKGVIVSGGFNKIVVIGGTVGDVLGFTYKTTYNTTAETTEVTAGPVILSVSPTSLPNVNSSTTVTGLNFATDITATFTGTDNLVRNAKSLVRGSANSLVITRPDSMPTTYSPYTLIVTNPSVAYQPTGSASNTISVTAGVNPVWVTSGTLTQAYNNVSYTTTLSATDADGGSSITYSIVSGSLPTGINLTTSTGIISGTSTSTTSNNFSFTIRATDSGGNFTDQTLSLLYLGSIINLDPSTIVGNDSTWVDRSAGVVLNKTGTTSKSGTYQVYMSSGNRWGYSTHGSTPYHLSSLDFAGNPFSLEMWIYMPTTSFSQTNMNYSNSGTQNAAGWRIFLTNGQFWSQNEWDIYVPSSGDKLGFATYGTYGLEYSLSSIGTGWKHVLMVKDGSGRKMYINGSLVTSDSQVDTIGVNTALALNINGYSASGVFETGYGDQTTKFGSIRIYNNAISSTIASATFNAEKSRYGL